MSKKIFENKYFWWGLGLIIVLIATSVEVFRGRNTNYFDYQDSTRMFWEGLSPYNLEYVQAHQIYFLYSPVFSVLFAPIFYLPWWLGPYIWNIGNYTLFFTCHQMAAPATGEIQTLYLHLPVVGSAADHLLLPT